MYKTRVIQTLFLCGLVAGICGCSLLPSIIRPNKPATVYNWREEITTKPKAVITDGKVVVVQEEHKVLEASVVIPKVSFMQRIGNWLGGLSIIGIIVLIVFLVLCPGATIAWLVKQVFKWKNALKETAAAIKDAKAVESDNALELALKEKQSDETKKLIGQIRSTI